MLVFHHSCIVVVGHHGVRMMHRATRDDRRLFSLESCRIGAVMLEDSAFLGGVCGHFSLKITIGG